MPGMWEFACVSLWLRRHIMSGRTFETARLGQGSNCSCPPLAAVWLLAAPDADLLQCHDFFAAVSSAEELHQLDQQFTPSAQRWCFKQRLL